MNTVEKNLECFASFIFVLRIFGLIKLKENETIAEKVTSRVHIISIIILFLSSLIERRNLVFTDPVAYFCQLIDKGVIVVCLTTILLIQLLFPHNHQKIFKRLGDVDQLLQIAKPLNYRKSRYFNNFCVFFNMFGITGYIIIVCSLTAIQKQYYFIFATSAFMASFLQFFYVIIVIHIFLRIKKLEEILLKSNVHELKSSIHEIFKRFFKFYEIMNEQLGLTILIIMGKYIYEIFFKSLIFKYLVKQMVRITTRIYLIHHIIKFDYANAFGLSSKINEFCLIKF